jgi:hypothetical protein
MEMDDRLPEQWMTDLEGQNPFLDEASFLGLLEDRVSQLLADQPDLLWSFLYRLDVEESKIRKALQSPADAAHALALLILDRQKQRVATKKAYREGPGREFNPPDL